MRIDLIAPLVAPIAEPQEGGAQAAVADLAQGLVGRGHEVRLYAAAGSSLEGVGVTTLGIDHTALVEPGQPRGALRRTTPALADAYRRIIKDIGTSSGAVVHSHGFDAAAITVAAAAGIGVLHTLHLPPDDTMVAAINAARTGPTPVWCATVSAAQASSWGRHLSIDAVLPNGIPTTAIAAAAAGIEPQPRHAVIAARLSREKGVAEGVEAARRAGWSVDVVGRPWDPDHVRELRRRWHGDARVRFLGAVDRVRLWRCLAGAAAVLCLSQWDEPFGMVAAESQAAGTPVIASRRGALAEIVRDGITGRLVADGDILAAADALGHIDDIDRDACRRHAQVHLGLEAALDRHEALYRVLAAAAPQTSF